MPLTPSSTTIPIPMGLLQCLVMVSCVKECHHVVTILEYVCEAQLQCVAMHISDFNAFNFCFKKLQNVLKFVDNFFVMRHGKSISFKCYIKYCERIYT